MDNYPIETDHLAIGLTKSPMFMGVNIRLFFANLIVSAMLCIDFHTFWGIPLFLINHLFMVKMSFKEPDFLFIWFKSMMNTPPIFNYRYWGKVNSYEV
jgi:type IV secretory pathway VirB3-like protein